MTVFNPYFIYFDQFLGVLPNTVQCVGLAALIMLIVSLVFIPNPICSLWVAFAIMSIELGVLGFMAFWGINLDAISMINLIMSIGFSVDFAAHISYSYMDSEGTPDDRVRNSLYSLGLPICQVFKIKSEDQTQSLAKPGRHIDNFGCHRSDDCPLLHLCHLLQDGLPRHHPWRTPWPLPTSRSPLALWSWILLKGSNHSTREKKTCSLSQFTPFAKLLRF